MYRANAQTRRGNRSGYPEHDDFEGLPVRQWRQEWVTVAPAAQVEAHHENDIWARELPYGMPKDSQLLAPHSLELLRAARSGRLYKRPAPADDDDAELDAGPDKADKKEDVSAKGYSVKVWKQVPRNAEGATISYLAKRRKNTVTLKPKAEVLQSTGSSITRATIRRVDAAGNPYEQTITLTEGQPVDGEIISTSVVPMPAVEAVLPAQQTTPVRRKPPPPRRKPKGPGRGRKKGRLPLPASTRPPSSVETAEGAGASISTATGGVGSSAAAPLDGQAAQAVSNLDIYGNHAMCVLTKLDRAQTKLKLQAASTVPRVILWISLRTHQMTKTGTKGMMETMATRVTVISRWRALVISIGPQNP